MTARCSHTSRDGRPCRAWAVKGSDPPTCAAHAGLTAGAGAPPANQNAVKHGFYACGLRPEELADLINYAGDFSLDDEIAVMRTFLRRALLAVTDESAPDPLDFARIGLLAVASARTVARLLRDKRAISGEAADAFADAIGTILDEVSTMIGVDL